jgi:hypothetical protein
MYRDIWIKLIDGLVMIVIRVRVRVRVRIKIRIVIIFLIRIRKLGIVSLRGLGKMGELHYYLILFNDIIV